MPKGKHRVIFDTNIWVSFLLTKDFSEVDQLIKDDKLTLLFNQELLDEFLEVAQRPKFKKYFSKTDLQSLISKISTKAEFVLVTTSIELCRDPKDNFLLSLAKDGRASHLITGDKDLLVLEKLNQTEILTSSEYFAQK
ncbi:putative toxin-antitoxin system toxin component, PIN family [uncultured Algoriphagus sp.]|uniref:putative toxin-antitoxin system toxin component, PIN family n=1 Tax=uncultured Algoriphagus sp. TaxID=417365 RepID=UPI0030EF5D55|tara:strand:- start:7571 stop:7984 length:414 start_codon:yes stop_codon:yes gene_type:complete